MASKPLVLTDPNLLAEFVRESEFKAFFEKRFATSPDLAALLFRNGELIDSFKGAHFSVGGLATALKSVVGGSSHIALMLADLKPFQIKMPLSALSRDHVEITGLATFELQLNPDKPSNILGLMSGVSRHAGRKPKKNAPEAGRKALSKHDVLDRIAPHLTDRVIEAVIGRMDATDIRGETGLQNKIQADIMVEAERVCGDIGILVNAVSVEWAMNAAEREAFERANITRQQDAMDYQLELLQREVSRQTEATEIKITANVDISKLQNASEDELSLMVLNSEVNFLDARTKATRRQEMDALAHEIEILRVERSAKMDGQIIEAGHLIDLTKEAARLRKTERDIEELDAKHMATMAKIGAYSDIEIQERRARMELEIAAIAGKQARENMEKMARLDQENADRQTDRDIKIKRTDSDARKNDYNAAKNLTPEQIMAINAGLSPDVANILMEEARAKGRSGANMMEVMRDLVSKNTEARDSERAHVLDILKAGMTGAGGVARGAGGKASADETQGDGGMTSATHVDCPSCGKTQKAKARFCNGCGHKMRT